MRMVRHSLAQTKYSPELWLLLASAFITPVIVAFNPLHAESTNHWSSLARRNLLPSSTTSASAPITVEPQPASNSPSNSDCVRPPLNNSTWIQLGIDSYLASLPNGASLNLHQYAASVGAPNFICGVGERCEAGQLCSPVPSPGWEVLVAAQEWNNYQNKFYEAVGTAVQMVTSISSSLVVDLYPPSHTGQIWDLFNSFSLASGITSGVIGAMAFFIGLGAVFSAISFITLPTVAVVFGGLGIISIQEALKHRGQTAFDQFSVYAFYLSEWQKHAQKGIANSTRSIIASGVSSAQGISSVLQNGTFFRERPSFNEAELIGSLKNTTTVRILTDILRSQGGFVSIAEEKCNGKGPGGARKTHDHLSYCSPNGTMFNIIQSGKKKAHIKWWNADLIAKKYGISVQYLTEQSYFCQLNHGASNFDPYKSSAFPKDLSAECVSNLPVCDFRNPDIADAKKEKNIMHACRDVAKLPI